LRGGKNEEYEATGSLSTYVVLCWIWDHGDLFESREREFGREDSGRENIDIAQEEKYGLRAGTFSLKHGMV